MRNSPLAQEKSVPEAGNSGEEAVLNLVVRAFELLYLLPMEEEKE